MPRQEIVGQDLVSCEMAVDGSRFRMGFARPDGSICDLDLPSACLQSLVMTLPRMLAALLRARHGDESLRFVYPTAQVRIEQAAEPGKLILTLTTADGFEMAFALNDALFKAFEIARHRLEREAPNAPSSAVSPLN
jgi:hypothetical protein